MNDQILRIQRMVAEGKVSPEESLELLGSVGGPAPGNVGAAEAGADASALEKKHRRELLYHRLALALALLGVFVCFRLYAEARRERNDLRRELESAASDKTGTNGPPWAIHFSTSAWRPCPTTFSGAQSAWKLYSRVEGQEWFEPRVIIGCVEREQEHTPPNLESAMDGLRGALHDIDGYEEDTACVVSHPSGRKALLIEYSGTYEDVGLDKPYSARFKTYGFLRSGKLWFVTGIIRADSDSHWGEYVEEALNSFTLD